MPVTFTISKPREALEQQWAYLAKRGWNSDQLAIKTSLLVLAVITGLYLLLYFLTATNNFITLKVIIMVMIALAWCAFFIFYLTLVFGNFRSRRRLRQYLDSITADQLTYSVQIDEEKVTVTTKDHACEMCWTEFSRFGIHKETIYVFNDVESLNMLFWDRSEMGSENFSALLDLLQQKSLKQMF